MKTRIKWGCWEYYQPIRLTILWKTAKSIKYGKSLYFISDCIMEYKNREFELCIPYWRFVNRIRQLRPEYRERKLEFIKTRRYEKGGMIINYVDEKNAKSKRM